MICGISTKAKLNKELLGHEGYAVSGLVNNVNTPLYGFKLLCQNLPTSDIFVNDFHERVRYHCKWLYMFFFVFMSTLLLTSQQIRIILLQLLDRIKSSILINWWIRDRHRHGAIFPQILHSPSGVGESSYSIRRTEELTEIECVLRHLHHGTVERKRGTSRGKFICSYAMNGEKKIMC